MTDFSASYNRDEFIAFLRDSFLPSKFEEKIETQNYKPPTNGRILEIMQLGSCEIENDKGRNKLVSIYEITCKSQDARITQTREIFKFMRDKSVEYALAVFTSTASPDSYRFSFIKTLPRDNNGKLEFEYSNPKRFSFLLGAGHQTRTPREYLIERGTIKTLEDLGERFSVEILTKEFYGDLYKWYKAALESAKFAGKNPNKEEHLIRLITRLMFIWFIKQKDLIPRSLFDVKEISKIIKNFDPQSQNSGVYYNAILQNLFFAVLNCAIKERVFAEDSKGRYGDKKYLLKQEFRDNNGSSFFAVPQSEIIKRFETIPFLNGGLFECLIDQEHSADDGFSRDEKKRAFIPNSLFFDEEKGLLNILNKYNWTIEENTPDDIDVALDPELLGKVFEELLGEYNSKTQQVKRKETGSFYTPRQVVQFMIDESLSHYLAGKIDGNLGKAHSLITSIDLTPDLQKDGKYLADAVEHLKSVKILDPACGSGAFPMGCLNRIVETICKIRHDTNRYDLKLKLIENNIYGVDIQNIAVQISKLRFFMALVAEQDRSGDKNDNYKIRPLPNLETKFIAANALIEPPAHLLDELNLEDKELKKYSDELLEIRSHKYVNPDSYKKKLEIRKRDEYLCSLIEALIEKRLGKPNKELIKQYEEEIARCEIEKKKYAGEKKEKREIKEGILFEEKSAPKIVEIDVNEEERKKIDERIAGYKSKISFEKSKSSTNSQIEALRKLIKWNPYNITGSADSFYAPWMFQIKEGFDIVIGNPPYIHLEDLKGDPVREQYEKQGFKSYDKRGDIYQLFYERGLNLLKDSGYLCFITSNKWLRASYGEKSRLLLSEKYNPKILLDLGGGIFKSAAVDTNILLIEKTQEYIETLSCKCKQDSDIEKMSDLIRQEGIYERFDNGIWAILNPIEKSIKEKIEKIGTPLKDW
ncbi:MAG: N-6 DNA methylase, partial [Elusimicrobiota bacterium]|nr:N-6 DNA methylase [Elusimicrobiota bacterium]